MTSWETQLKEFYSITKQLAEKRKTNNTKLRFNRVLIRASDIADQYYCEKKVEMRYTYGKIETMEMVRGSQWHERLLKNMAKIDLESLWKKIYEEKPIYVSDMLLLTRYKDVVLAGVPDAVVFESGRPIVVFEYKFTRTVQPSISHNVQVGTYGLLLQNVGFDTTQLLHAIILVDPKLRGDPELRQKVVQMVSENGPKEAVLEVNNVRVFTAKFNQEQAQRNLDWAIEYWRLQREAIPTENSSKCGKCEYLHKCKGKSFRSDALISLPLVGSSRADAFEEIGIKSIESVAKIDPFDPIFRNYSCFYPDVLSLIKIYAEAAVQNKILVKRKADLLKNEKICFVDLEYDPIGTSNGPYSVFLIGILDENGKVTQHFLDDPKDESILLEKFMRWYVNEKPVLVAYSSTRADRPQLLNSLDRLKLSTFGIEGAFFDLYSDCVNTQSIGLQNVFLPILGPMGLKDVSVSLGFQEPSDLKISNGLQALSMYSMYLKNRNELAKSELLRYNLVDLERTKFVFDKIREALETTNGSLVSEMKIPSSNREVTIERFNVSNFKCPKCGYFLSSKYIKGEIPKKCCRCGYLFCQK